MDQRRSRGRPCGVTAALGSVLDHARAARPGPGDAERPAQPGPHPMYDLVTDPATHDGRLAVFRAAEPDRQQPAHRGQRRRAVRHRRRARRGGTGGARRRAHGPSAGSARRRDDQARPDVDFAEADLPWRYTPRLAAGDRLPPWMVLIVGTTEELRVDGPAVTVLQPSGAEGARPRPTRRAGRTCSTTASGSRRACSRLAGWSPRPSTSWRWSRRSTMPGGRCRGARALRRLPRRVRGCARRHVDPVGAVVRPPCRSLVNRAVAPRRRDGRCRGSDRARSGRRSRPPGARRAL